MVFVGRRFDVGTNVVSRGDEVGASFGIYSIICLPRSANIDRLGTSFRVRILIERIVTSRFCEFRGTRGSARREIAVPGKGTRIRSPIWSRHDLLSSLLFRSLPSFLPPFLSNSSSHHGW